RAAPTPSAARAVRAERPRSGPGGSAASVGERARVRTGSRALPRRTAAHDGIAEDRAAGTDEKGDEGKRRGSHGDQASDFHENVRAPSGRPAKIVFTTPDRRRAGKSQAAPPTTTPPRRRSGPSPPGARLR